jgi:hypothetical protein
MKTMAGEIAIARDYHRCRNCGYTELPFDEVLGTSDLEHKMTKNFMVEVAYYGQSQSSFSHASNMIKRATGMSVSSETVRGITEDIGCRVFKADEIKAKHTLEHMDEIETSNNPKGTIFVLMDGAAVNTRVQDENGSTWRENKTVMVFRDKDMIKRANGDHIIVKKEYMPFIGSADEFKKFVLDAAVRAGYGKAANIVIVADGATWIRNLCDDIFPDGIQILDLFHLKENIFSYGKYIFNDDPKQYNPWAKQVIDKIELGHTDEALALIPELTDNAPAGVVNLRTYIENNRGKINYPDYKAKGFFVGSGAIESANKIIVQRRLKQSGMRWGVKGAQSVLTLRSKDESGLWEKEKNIFTA